MVKVILKMASMGPTDGILCPFLVGAGTVLVPELHSTDIKAKWGVFPPPALACLPVTAFLDL